MLKLVISIGSRDEPVRWKTNARDGVCGYESAVVLTFNDADCCLKAVSYHFLSAERHGERRSWKRKCCSKWRVRFGVFTCYVSNVSLCSFSLLYCLSIMRQISSFSMYFRKHLWAVVTREHKMSSRSVLVMDKTILTSSMLTDHLIMHTSTSKEGGNASHIFSF